ncbi:putative diphthamide synthesis protein-domain-containing protein [Vararia minispora EC-137]|uniref:Diphthamide synthesis protein-domain-containing protein n=1 Tax=Vararia minispora EC-137 TaxID=1314806 RepID=A0ACB8Q9J2_9AGAM|nr:putative diphthamide synthesis protein-domain-containing protein [Vararia minispora EC-137]
MAEASAFSASGEDVTHRPVEVDEAGLAPPRGLSPSEFDEFYDIDRIAHEVSSGGYKRTALQFPDELLPDSVPIYRALKRRLETDRELYVLADTSYGSCCADEVAAQHVDAEAIVHYGHACMSKTYRMPVLYVFGKKPADVQDAAEQLVWSLKSSGDLPKRVVFRHYVAYTHTAESILGALRRMLSTIDIEVLYEAIPHCLDPTSSKLSLLTSNGLDPQLRPEHVPIPSQSNESDPILYVGPENLGLTNLLLTHSSAPIHRYDPASRTCQLESTRTNKLLMRRYAVVQRARDADVFGILVGTLGVASYLPLIKHLRQTLARAHKKSYTIAVGKLNPAKLANFAEVECFVLVACPENSLIDAKDFYRPIVTPFELQIALQFEPTWNGKYVLDFERLLFENAALSSSEDHMEGKRDVDEPAFSLITGKYRHAKRYGIEGTDAGVGNGLVRSEAGALVMKNSAAAEFFQSRTYKGLDVRAGMDAPSVLEQGRSGIARGYTDDH